MGNFERDTQYDTEDTILMTLYFPNNVQFTIELSWAASFRNSYYAVYGSEESMIIENDSFSHTSIDQGISIQTLKSDFDDPSHQSWFVSVLNDFKKIVPYIRPDGIVLMHDTHPSMRSHLLGSYRACLKLRQEGYSISHILNTWWGLWVAPE